VRGHHERQKILAAAQTASDSHYEYQVTTSNREITVGVLPKYPGAEQDKPLTISGQFKFDLKTPEGAEAFSKFERMLKAGEDFEVDSRFIEKFHLPETFSKIFALPNDSRPASISITSIPDKEIRPVRYTFESGDGRFRSEFPYVEYKVIRAGTEETLLSNEGQSISAKFQTLSSRNGRVQFRFEAKSEGRSAKEVLNLLHLQAVFAVGGTAAIEFLKTGAHSKETVPPSSMSMPEDWVMKLAEYLSFIERVLQISVIWPKVVRHDDTGRIQPIAQILRTGTATGFIDQHIALRSSSKQFKWLTENYEPGSVTKYRVTMPAYRVDVFGTEIDLGPVEITIPTGRFTEESEALILSKRQVADDETVALAFKSGVEPAGYRFMRWLPIDSDESNSKT
jgi:hypothetical protein